METGLREHKKAQTRRRIAVTAARLFAERGYENVAVIDVARAAEVSEQTVYNYFPAKQRLVLDQDEALRDRLTQLIRDRPPGTSPAAAIRGVALAFVEAIRILAPEEARGGLGYLAAISPAIRRLSLEMTDRHADAIAAAITDTAGVASPAVAKVQAIALAWVFQTITDQTGQRTRDGQNPAQIASQLRPITEAILDDLDRWLSPPDQK